MADFFCSFLDFRSFNASYNLPLILPSKNYYYRELHSHNPIISRIKRRSFHLTLLSASSSRSPSSSELDVISTHEHSDGSLLFRFGDPNEVVENVKTEEPKAIKEEIYGKKEEGSSVIRVVDDNETGRDVTRSSATDMADHPNSIVSNSKLVTVVEGESEQGEKLLQDSSNAELPASTSSQEMENMSTTDVDIEHIENEEELDEEYEDSRTVESSLLDEPHEKLLQDSSDAEMPVLISSREMEDMSTPDVDIEHTENDESLNEENPDQSMEKSSLLDEDSNIERDIASVELSEEGSAGITATPDINIENAVNVDEGLDEEQKESSTAISSMHDESPEGGNNTSRPGYSEKEASEVTSTADPNIVVPDNGFPQTSLDTVFRKDGGSLVSELQNVETDFQNGTTEDNGGTFDGNLVSLSSDQSEPAVSSSKQIEEQKLLADMQNVIDKGNAIETSDAEAEFPSSEAAIDWPIVPQDQASGAGIGMQNEAIGYARENGTIQLMTEPPQLEDDSVLEEEADVGTVEESSKVVPSEYPEENMPQDLALGSEKTEAKHSVQGGDIVETSEDEGTVTESTPMSQEVLTSNFVLSSGAALLPHPSKVLTGGEDAYFIAGQTWLGVADGVGQWSLEGTSPGVYAQELMKICERLISIENGDSISNPMEFINRGVAETRSCGSATVLIAQFDSQALHVANVGDSGFIVLRDGFVHKRSSPMHHVFHFPLQIESGVDPSSLAELYRVDLEEDDVVITATDGLLDNLYDEEISSIVTKSIAADKRLEEIAELLAMKAQEIGSSASVRTPFADDAQAAGFAGYMGGKLDDVAVIVSVVQRQ